MAISCPETYKPHNCDIIHQAFDVAALVALAFTTHRAAFGLALLLFATIPSVMHEHQIRR